MKRRSFLKAITTIGAAAAIPASLIPAWKTEENECFKELQFRGHEIVYSKYCPRGTVYFLNPKGIFINDGNGWRNHWDNHTVVMNPYDVLMVNTTMT